LDFSSVQGDFETGARTIPGSFPYSFAADVQLILSVRVILTALFRG